jgi:ATP-binding cassette subfamily F protein 3
LHQNAELISINNITKSFGAEVIFSQASFSVNPKERLGLAGKNGSGKTTLLKIIAGKIESTTGDVIVPERMTVGYLPQETKVTSKKTVLDETLSAFEFLEALQIRLDEIVVELGNHMDFESDSYFKLLDEQNAILDQLRLAEPEKLLGTAEKILAGLGFQQTDLKRPLPEFSFGWKMRVELAKLLLLKPSLLLLDEPTNHLDIESIQWLEDFLLNYQGSVIIVSHDRTLLDNLTNRTIEINNGKLYDYKVSYSKYIELRDERQSHLKAAFNNQQKEIQEIERFIERFRYKNTKAKQVQSRIKTLDKMDVVELDDLDKNAIHFSFPPAPSSGKVTVEGKSISKNYGNLQVLSNLDFQILRGEKVAFVGRNGEGKTTLAKIIASKLPYDGELKIGHNVIPAYFSQDQWDMLDPQMTVFETLDAVAVGDIRKRLQTILGAFLFQGDDIEKKVSVLSGGEKSRLALAKLLLMPSNLLIMDEPTNHLDLMSKDILKNALLQYTGTLLIVSHDRDFLQGLTTRLYEFRDRKIKEYRGDIFDYLEKRKLTQLKELETKQKETTVKPQNKSENKLQWEKKKEQEKQSRKLKSQIAKVESDIEKLEAEIEKLNQKLAEPDQYEEEIKSGEFYRQHDKLNGLLDKSMEEWEKLHTILEEMESE